MELRIVRTCVGFLTLIAAASVLAKVGTAAQSRTTSPSAAKPDDLPASETTATATLQVSPRHGEWINVMDRAVLTRTFVVHAPQGGRSSLVLVIPDERGLNDWARAICDQLAREGFTAIAPDLVMEAGPNGGGTASLPNQGVAARALAELPNEQVMQRLEGVWNYAMRFAGMTGKGAVIGFGRGGTYAFRFAGSEPEVGTLSGAVVFYGAPPDRAALGRTSVPVLGFYAGDDPAVTETVDATTSELKRLGKSFESVLFPGASHGFVRAQSERGANLSATEQAWSKAIAFLKERTK